MVTDRGSNGALFDAAPAAGPGVPNGRERSIRETKCAGRAHFYTFQSEGQFNCGGRPIRPSAIFSASNRPPGTVNVCARAPPNDIYIYIDTVLEWDLEQRRTLKCICGAGLTTNFKFFPPFVSIPTDLPLRNERRTALSH